MLGVLVLPLAAVAALLAATLASFRDAAGTAGRRFWLLGGAAAAGAAAVVALRSGGPAGYHWDSSLSTALWWSIACCLLLFGLISLFGETARRLAPLLFGYLLLLALIALLSGGLPGHVQVAGEGGLWLPLHIAISLATYALSTLAAVAGLAVFLRERALKRKQDGSGLLGGLVERLPSIADGERLQFRLLGVAEAVLGAGLATGLALDWVDYGRLIALDHKTLLSVLAFLLVALLLLLHARGGLRGRRAARLALLAYLLLTLSYIGVKVVTDVLQAA